MPESPVHEVGPTSQAAVSAAAEPRRRATAGSVVQRLHLARYSGVYLWGAFILIFAIWVPSTFLTWTTVKSVGTGEAVTGVLALAVLFPLAAGEFDLSIAQNMGFSAIL